MQNKRMKSDIVPIDISSSSSEEEENDDVDYVGDSSDEDICVINSKKRKKMEFCRADQTKKRESKMCHQCQRYPGMPEEDFLKACPVCRNVCNCIACLRNYCSAFIVDFHWSCSRCSYELCLTCCKELRNGKLQADASELRMQYINNGPDYLHGKGCSIISVNNETTEAKVAMTSKWKSMESGAIRCPPKDMGGCGKGTLHLRCIFSENWISQLLLNAKEIAQKCKLKEMHHDSELHCSCSKSKGDNGVSGGKLRKAAARENSDDNYVFCPAAVDTRRANLRHFRLYLSKGEPVVVTNVHDNALGLSWEPMVMWCACRQTEKATDVLNCLNWCKLEMNIHQFFKGYMEGRSDSHEWPTLLKLNDWPPSGLFDERLPRHGAEFSSCLPFIEYSHPQYGYLNLSLRLPDGCWKPDLGPKAYIAYGFPMELGRGDSVTKLRYAVTDTVNVLMHTQDVLPTVKQLSALENLKQIHNGQDQREFLANAHRMHEGIKDCIPSVNGKCSHNCDDLKVEYKKYSRRSVKLDCETNKEGEEYRYREDSVSLIVQDRCEGFEEADGGALWDVFRRQDVPKLEEYLRKHFREFRHIYGSPLPLAVHPIFDETFYLSTEHKKRLKEEYGIEPWTFVQKLGEAVFVPAGCPHQVRNLKCCINVAVDFVSPENVTECIRFFASFPEIMMLRKTSWGYLDPYIFFFLLYFRWKCKENNCSCYEPSSGSIGEDIISMPGPSTPKSSSISADLSSSKTVRREKYVAPSENEKPRTQVNVHSPLPDLDNLSVHKAMPGPSMLKSPSVSEDLSSRKTVKREEYVNPPSPLPVLDHLSPANKAMSRPIMPKSSSAAEIAKREEYFASSEVEKPRAEVNQHSPLPVLSANKAQESTPVPSQELKPSIKIEDVESTFQTIQSFLKSLPEKYSSQQTGPQSSSNSTLTLAKLVIDCSMRLPLEALAHDQMNEKELCGAIAALSECPSSFFSDKQGKQLVKLKYEFPVMVKKWRYLAQDESRYQEFLTNFEEDRKKLSNWTRLEETLKSEYYKREEQARELEAILQTISTRQKEINDARQEASQEAQKLMLLVQEKVGKTESTSTELETTKMQMNSLRKNWCNFQSKFP
ncbi:putative 60S acidic ribosomal protein P0-1-like [Capsicum annuum]|nr:putative 60S acidic ribosomal protein P0-1-like [Capsicum annuum]